MNSAHESIFEKLKNRLEFIRGNIKWLAVAENILAVYGDDIDTLVEKIPLSLNPDSKCKNCGQLITKENLGGWIKAETGFEVFCDLPLCFPANNQGSMNE